MPLKIVRNDITKMNTEAIVNTANAHTTVRVFCLLKRKVLSPLHLR